MSDACRGATMAIREPIGSRRTSDIFAYDPKAQLAIDAGSVIGSRERIAHLGAPNAMAMRKDDIWRRAQPWASNLSDIVELGPLNKRCCKHAVAAGLPGFRGRPPRMA